MKAKPPSTFCYKNTDRGKFLTHTHISIYTNTRKDQQTKKEMGNQNPNIRKKRLGWWVVMLTTVAMIQGSNSIFIAYYQCAGECYMVETFSEQTLCLGDCMKHCTWSKRKCKASTLFSIPTYIYIYIYINFVQAYALFLAYTQY